jgi:methylenetetrahydrofolate dehydrogenase (NADP+) / methenyltetrahydrofolate cyclohydrolase
MTAHIIDGRAYADDLKQALTREVDALAGQGVVPGLATVLVADNYSAKAYERRVRRLTEELGCYYACELLDEQVDEAEAVATVGKLDADPRVSGILVLRPLPDHVSEVALYRALNPMKDIEAVHPVNAGLLALGRPRFIPSTPASVFHMLDRYLTETRSDTADTYARSNMVVVGRSNNVGKPAIHLGFARGATVASCDEHSYAAGLLYAHTRDADIVIVAAGVPKLVTGDHVKDGVIAIDVGINPERDPDSGKVHLVGDLDFDSVADRAEAVSPVPGGVGPITDVWLVRNAVWAAKIAASIEAAEPSLEGLYLPPDHGAPPGGQPAAARGGQPAPPRVT